MRKLLLGFSALVALCATPAAATVLTFDGNICGGGNPCGNSSLIDQTYGDETGLDVIWDSDLATIGTQNAIYWTTGYRGLTNVAYAAGQGAFEIFLKPLAGYQVALNGFNLSDWLSSPRNSQVTILGGNGSPLLSTGPIVVGSVLSYGPYAARSDGFRIQYGPDNFNVGIDNISFEVSRIGDGPGPIPEPATWALMIGGFGLAGAALRRRRTLSAV